MESTEGELGTGLADRLGGDNAYGLALLDHTVVGEVSAVALGANALLALAGEDGTDLDALDGRSVDGVGDSVGDFLACSDEDFAGEGVYDVVDADAAEDALAEGSDDFIVLLYGGADEAAEGSAVFLVDDDVVSDVDETAGEVTGVGGLQGGIGETLTGTVGGDEVLEHGEAFLEVRENRVLDNLSAFCARLLGLGHKATHAGELTNLVLGTTGTGVKHHVDGVEALVCLGHLLHEDVGEACVDVGPDIDNLLVAFLVGDYTHSEVLHDFGHLVVTFLDNRFLFRRDEHVAEVEGKAALEGHIVTEVLDVVKELGRAGNTALLDYAGDDVAKRFLRENHVDVTDFLGHVLVYEDAAYGGVMHEVTDGIAVLVDVIDHYGDGCVESHAAFVVSDLGLFGAVENVAFSLVALTELGDVVEAEDHVLRGDGDRRSVCGVEDVVGTEHEHLGLEDSLVTEGKVDGHLVAVEVGIEGGTCEGVELDSLAFDELGLECLDAEAVKRRGTVEKDGVALHDVLEDIPYDGFLAVDDFLCALDGLDDAALDELADDEGLVELGGHVLGEAALVHLELGADDDYGTCGVVDALTEEVLTEATLLALEGVGEGLEGTVCVALHGRALAGVVEEGVDGFLKHALLVSEDNLGGLDFEEALQTVVAYDYATVEVVEVGSCEASAVEGHERTELGGNDGHCLKNHPLGLVAVAGSTEGLDDLKALEGLGLALLAAALGVGEVAELIREGIEVELLEEVVDGLGAHLGDELVGITVLELLVSGGKAVENLEILFLAEELELLDGLGVVALAEGDVGGGSGIDDDVTLVIDDCVELLGGKAEEITDLVGEGAEVPDVGYRDDEGDVSHSLAADFLFGDFDAATVADDALVADALVLTAVALVILYGTEDSLAEETVAFRLVCTVVDRLRLEHLAAGLLEDFLGRSQADGDLREGVLCFVFFSESHISG